ncbi:MAG: hypothetical protein JST24_03620 [Acidobacteria bacterium]|nr:hypothetical protein [Acidobacteriota bacterium]
MGYSRDDWDWLEAEWAFQLHGRSAFLSREDFAQIQAWEENGVPAEAVVAAMEAYFARRAKRARPRSFVAVSHLDKDVAKVMKLRSALQKAGDAPVQGGWDEVKEPLRSDASARAAFEAWRRAQAALPLPDSAAYLDAFDAERAAFALLLAKAEAALGPQAAPMQADLKARLLEAKIPEDGLVWRRAWTHHWGRKVAEAWGLPSEG